MSRLYDLYKDKLNGELQEKFGYKNVMEIPRLKKIVINMGVGEGSLDRKHIQNAVDELTAISGQKVVITKAKKSEAGFKIREGMAVGVKVTLRGERMYEFMDRLVTIAMPRIRDFRGISAKGFDGNGNYNMGLQEQMVFAEINYDKVDQARGMDIAFVTSAKTNDEAKALLEGFNMPFPKAA